MGAADALRRDAVPRPNILLLMSDQQRFDNLGCTGADWVRTPHLDRLAAEGALFGHCYANNPVCTPSRASLLTGKELPGHGVYRLHDVLPADEVMIAERLRDRGYETALFGKLHVSGRIEEAGRRHPHDGFDVYEWCLEPALDLESPFNGYAGWLRARHPDFYEILRTRRRHRGHDPVEASMNRWAADRTVDFLQRHAARPGGMPFFCLMSVFDPHNPYDNYPREEIAAWMPSAADLRDSLAAEGDYGACRDYAVCAYRNSGIDDTGRYWDPPIDSTMVRRGRYKLHVYHPVEGRQRSTIYRFFDMEADPHETRDLSADGGRRADLDELKDCLIDWLRQAENLRGGRGGSALPAPDQLVVNRIK